MGQTVEIRSVAEVGELLLLDTDRSLTGQDGYEMSPDEPGSAVPGRLAERLFGLDTGIDHVFVLQNTITVRRPGGWDESTLAGVKDEVQSFLRFYREEPEPVA
jgi:hypothetical protein